MVKEEKKVKVSETGEPFIVTPKSLGWDPWLKALTSYADEDYEKTFTFVTEALKLEPTNKEFLKALAKVSYMLKEIKEVEAPVEKGEGKRNITQAMTAEKK